MDRRDFFQGSAVAAAAVASGCASPGASQQAPRTIEMHIDGLPNLSVKIV